MGAYYLSEGTFFSAHQFSLWLQKSGNELEPSWEEAVLGHLLFGISQPFRGRTPSYLEFHEVRAEDSNEKVLRVHYSESSQPFWAEYRRPSPNAQNGRTQPVERFPKIDGKKEWKSLVYSPKHHTFVSFRMPSNEQKAWAVPNKVSSWLLGKPTAPLVTVKPYTMKGKTSCTHESPQTPEYMQLQERRDGELWVNYRKEGWYIYSRSDDGNLGSERPSNRKEQQGLMYSETLKTLKSSILSKPLPNKVTDLVTKNR